MMRTQTKAKLAIGAIAIGGLAVIANAANKGKTKAVKLLVDGVNELTQNSSSPDYGKAAVDFASKVATEVIDRPRGSSNYKSNPYRV